MDQETLPTLPVICFSEEKMKPNTKSWFSACNEVRHALDEYGSFIAVYDKFSLQLKTAIMSALEELFNFPTQTKLQNTSDFPFCGYIGQLPDIPLLESLGIEEAGNLEKIKSFSKLMWAGGNNIFSEIIHEYAKLAVELEQALSRMIFESYGIEEKLRDNHMASTTYTLRFNKYRVPGPDETKTGAQVHTDKSFITILDQINQVNGLEVKTKDDRWIPVDFLPSSFVVMAGEGLLAWSNGRVQPAVHRVIMKGKETRFSVGLFSYHKGVVEIPEALIDEEHPRCFKPFDHLGLLNFYAKQMLIGRMSETTMKAYCGV